MLDHRISNIAAAAATSLLDKKLRVVPKPNSFLGQLCSLSAPIQSGQVPSSGELGNFTKAIENVTAGSGNELSLHSVAQDEVQVTLRELVSSHISVARNSIKPIVVDFAKAYIEFLSSVPAQNVFAEMCIEVKDPCELLFDKNFLQELSPFKENNSNKKIQIVNIGVKEFNDIATMAIPSTSRQVEQVRNWLMALDQKFVLDVWKSFFVRDNINAVYSFQNLGSLNPVDAANVSLLVYLLSQKLMAEPAEIEGMSLTDYQGMLSDYIKVAGHYVSGYATQIGAFEAAGRLVLMRNSYSKTMVVYGPVYRKWLEQGGNSDHILALLLTDDRVFSTDAVNDVVPKLKKVIENYATIRKVNEDAKQPDRLRDRAASLGLTGMGSPTDVEKLYAEQVPDYSIRASKLIQEELAKLTLDQLKDAHMVALLVVAKCRFFFTPAYEILSDIYEAGKVNPDFEAGEAATVAAIRYMAKFMVTQMSVQRV